MDLTALDKLLDIQLHNLIYRLGRGEETTESVKMRIADFVAFNLPVQSPCAKLLFQLIFDNPSAKVPRYVQRELLAKYLERVISSTIIDEDNVTLGITRSHLQNEDDLDREFDHIENMVLACRLIYFPYIPLKPEP